MAYREIRDAHGVRWEVWQVTPTMAERRADVVGLLYLKKERRLRVALRVLLGAAFRGGWLAFKSSDERRRLVPFPREWNTFSDSQLLGLLERSESVGAARRLIE